MHTADLYVPSYREHWEEKLSWYKTHDIVPHENWGENGSLSITTESRQGGISSQEIERVIRTAILKQDIC